MLVFHNLSLWLKRGASNTSSWEWKSLQQATDGCGKLNRFLFRFRVVHDMSGRQVTTASVCLWTNPTTGDVRSKGLCATVTLVATAKDRRWRLVVHISHPEVSFLLTSK